MRERTVIPAKTVEELDQEELAKDANLIETVSSYIAKIRSYDSSEDLRIAYSVIYGFLSSRSLRETINFYSLDEDAATKWWKEMGFDKKQDISTKKDTTRKSKDIEAYIKSNIGKTLGTQEILSSCGISNATLYNFIDKNRGYFRKAGRGLYEILDRDAERLKEKNGTNSTK